MEKEEKIYLDENGYKQYLKEIDDLKVQIGNNGRQKSNAYTSAVGDGWHDNFEFEDAKREELRLLGLLKEKIAGLSRIVIVDNQVTENLIDIGDYVTVNMFFDDEDEPESELFHLVALNSPDLTGNIPEISINSPLGKAVYKKKVGDKVSYTVRNNNISVLIINNSKSLDNDIKDENTLKRRK